MVDRYTKVVLTVIAVALVWLCLFGLAPKWGTPAEAYGETDVNIAAVGGKQISIGLYTSFSGQNQVKGIPVEIMGGSVEVDGKVRVHGTVDCE